MTSKSDFTRPSLGSTSQFFALIACFTLLLLWGSNAQAQVAMPVSAPLPVTKVEDDKAIVTLDLENDIFGGTDANYTNGVRLSSISSEEATPDSVRWIANNLLPVSTEGKKRMDFALGQNIYTPTNIKTAIPDPKDRPYAGWLYGSVGVVSDRNDRLDNVMLTVGMVGPHSYAYETQDFVHRAIDYQRPQGWHYQLKDEPGVILTMERTWRSLYLFDPGNPGGMQFDISPFVGTNLGNVDTDASVGATVRLGFDLPSDYGPPRIRPTIPGSDFFVPSETIGGYLFAGVQGQAVARNIFLDGNTFASSPSVDKKWDVGSLQAGATLIDGNVRLSYTQIFMTKEFDTQKNPEVFGSLTLSYRY